MYTITSPIEGHSEPSQFGGVTLEFQDGKATADELSDGLLAYLKDTGYTVEGGPETEDEQPEGEQFDPGQHTADEIVAYLDQLPQTNDAESDHHDAEVARVIEAEKAGKNRSTLLKALGGEQS